MANTHRGEVAITLPIAGRDKQFALRPTFRFIAAVEDECGCGIARLVRDFIAGEWKVSHLVTILTAGLAHDDGVDPRDVRDAVVAKGAMHFVPAALTLCANIMTDEDVRPAVPDRALTTAEPPDDARAGTDAAP